MIGSIKERSMSASHTPVRVRWGLPVFGFSLVLAALLGLIAIPSAGAAPPPPPQSVRTAVISGAPSYASSQPTTRISSVHAPDAPARVTPSYPPPSDHFFATQRVVGAGPADTTLMIRANRTHDWVQGEAPSDTTVYVTVKRDGQVIATGESATGGGTGWNVNPQRPEGGGVDMLTGDVVEVTAGAQSASVVLIDMDGAVNATTDVVSGKLVGVPFPADVQVEVWRNDGDNRNLQTSDDGTFSIDLGALGFDIHPGDMVGIWYVRPDGNMVGIVRSDFRLDAELRDNDIWGMTTANTRVDLTLLSGATVKGTTTAWSDREGSFGTRFRDAAGNDADIAAGDIISGAAGGKTATMTIPQPFSASYDYNADTICGQAPAGTQVQADLYGYGTQWPTATASNSYCATFAGNPGIEAEGEARIELPLGHTAHVRTRTPTTSLWLNKWSDGQPPSGGYHRYTLQVGNDMKADVAASGVVLTDVLPTGMTYVSASPSPTTQSGNTVVWNLGTIARGTERAVTVTAYVSPSVTPGTELENCADVTASGWENNLGNNTACDKRQVVENQADLSIGGGVSPGDPATGADYVYQIQYNNSRPAGSRNVRITDTLPDGVTFVSEWHPAGWTVDTSQAGKIIWQTDYLPGQNGRYLELRLHTDSGLSQGTQLHNRVEIQGEAPDADLNNNVWENDAGVQNPYINLAVDKGYSYGTPVAGHEYTTWIAARNQGNVIATGAELIDTLPAGATFVRAVRYDFDPATGDRNLRSDFPPASQGSGQIHWDLPDVANWREIWIEVTFSIGAGTAPGTELLNQADVTIAASDQDPDNNHAEYRFRTQAPGPNLRVTKWYDWGDVEPGGTVQYQLRFENDGTEPLYDLVLKDILPDHVMLNGFGWKEQPVIDGKTLTWTPNWPMNPGDQQGFWLQVRVDDGTPAGTILTNTAQGSSSTTEVLDTDNMAQVTLAVGPDLRVEKELLDQGIRPGHRARYRIRIWNDGHAQARNVVLTDILPSGLTFAGSNWGGEDQGDNHIVWHLPDLGPNWRGEFDMEVDAARDLTAGSTVTNQIEITNDAGDANPADNAFELASTINSPYLYRVQESDNWVNGEALPDAPVHIVLKDHLGAVKHTTDLTTGGDGSFFAGGFPDIVPGDTVEVTTEGNAAAIPVVQIDGTVNPTTDHIAGKVYSVAYPAKVIAEVWTNNGPSVEGQTDGAGNYDLNLAPFDVRNGHRVALWYVRPDGHEVGIVSQALFVRVYPTDDWLWGSSAPNTTVNVTLRNAADVLKGSATVTSGPDGNWSTDIRNGGTPVAIDDHDKVHVTAGAYTADLVVPHITVLPDAVHDRVEVYSELPNTGLDLRWDSSPNQNDHDLARGASVTTDGVGHASLDLGPHGGLDLGVAGNLYYYNADGQCIEPWWRAMVDAVSPGTLLNTADRTIIITGVGFEDTPVVYLGKNGVAKVQLKDVTPIGTSGTTLQATVPEGTLAATYDLQVYNADERIGFLADALTIRGWRIRLPLIMKNYP
jgi:uncharacterized repeat protein (TIGR01451 family)